jgi:hypothetical protein
MPMSAHINRGLLDHFCGLSSLFTVGCVALRAMEIARLIATFLPVATHFQTALCGSARKTSKTGTLVLGSGTDQLLNCFVTQELGVMQQKLMAQQGRRAEAAAKQSALLQLDAAWALSQARKVRTPARHVHNIQWRKVRCTYGG